MRLDFHRLRFLVIEDNPYMRRVIRMLLHGFGATEIHEAEDGASGLHAFTTFSPDIVVTDWDMPILDGLALTRRLRDPATSPDPMVPIIMITGFAERGRVVEARDAGVNEFLVKPISAERLYERILSVVANPRPFIRTSRYFGPDRGRAQPATTASGRRPRTAPAGFALDGGRPA